MFWLDANIIKTHALTIEENQDKTTCEEEKFLLYINFMLSIKLVIFGNRLAKYKLIWNTQLSLKMMNHNQEKTIEFDIVWKTCVYR